MKQKPLLISLLISLGTGVIAGFLTFKSMEQYQNEPPNNCENQNSVIRNIENQEVNLLSKEELCKRIEDVEKELKSYTWRELETNGKFAKNDKLSFIKDDMLIVGCDIGSETHYIRAIDIRGRELSRKAFEFSDMAEGFEAAKA